MIIFLIITGLLNGLLNGLFNRVEYTQQEKGRAGPPSKWLGHKKLMVTIS
ncbi:hypothetical protein UF75_0318 [Desulfosporosinus sp. I2]|nr:hypothetical protein UF75_0318 [Desulfosporosinus sp. I2]